MPKSQPDRAPAAAHILSQEDAEAIRTLLLGRRIVSAERGEFKTPGWRDNASGKLTLDDGTKILVVPNEGCGGCSAGWYEIEHLTTVDNAITDVRVTDEPKPGGYGEEERTYRIYVFADADEVNAVQIDGDDGNGYYGTGYELVVIPPKGAK